MRVFRPPKGGKETTAQELSKESADIRGYMAPGIQEDSLMVEPPGGIVRPPDSFQTFTGLTTVKK